jgi:hypothetical protein
MNKRPISVFDLEGKQLDEFLEKYGDIFEPRFVDFEYYKLYYLGKYDHHKLIFSYLQKTYDIHHVFYPGSFIHITPSFIFDHVTYIDLYDGIGDFFDSKDVLKYINLHKTYQTATQMIFVHGSYLNREGTYDLVISSNAGSISIDCKGNIKDNGLLLVNNGHSDADNAFADVDYEYLGYFKFNTNNDHVQFVIDGTSNKGDVFYLFRKRSK